MPKAKAVVQKKATDSKAKNLSCNNVPGIKVTHNTLGSVNVERTTERPVRVLPVSHIRSNVDHPLNSSVSPKEAWMENMITRILNSRIESILTNMTDRLMQRLELRFQSMFAQPIQTETRIPINYDLF